MLEWNQNARFTKIYPYVLNAEGGYVWNPKDPGGATKYGIAFNYNQGYLKKFEIFAPSQMKELTRDQALEIYYRKYWLPSQADELPDRRLALVYFDHVINAGQGAADTLLSKLGRNVWYNAGDGPNANYWWGMSTQYLLYRLWFYMHIKNWTTFGLGWFNRLLGMAKALPNM